MENKILKKMIVFIKIYTLRQIYKTAIIFLSTLFANTRIFCVPINT